MNTLFRPISLFFIVVMMFACSPQKGAEQEVTVDVESGVSRELALMRKAQIANLRYELWFYIPESKSDDVMGRVAIRFELEATDRVVIDYRADESNIESVMVNDKECDYLFENEHIIIAAQCMQAGENEVVVEFLADDQSLNRTEDQLYTLLVPERARTLFPCFDQPDMKAEFKLNLEIPVRYDAVSNTGVESIEFVDEDRVMVHFMPTEPLSTYLFSFVAGDFEVASYEYGDRTINAYYRDSDIDRSEQLDLIFEQVAYSLSWLEEYTGIPYPFAKYDLVIIPGFQYGGMEHTGATLYNESRMFLDDSASPDMLLQRANVIAHETAHMWFGDYVTMEWFDDVWTKEVFAGYFANLIVADLFPDVDDRMTWLGNVVLSSLYEDRTDGSTPIKQQLDNLQDAGLVYGNIIYNKAPIMMLKLVELMGEDAFRDGIREYLRTYAYGNATWEQLVAILDKHSDKDIAAFSDVWVHKSGMPHITLCIEGDRLVIRQDDKWGRELIWPQSFEVTLMGKERCVVHVELSCKEFSIPISEGCSHILPNTDGRGYGHFITSDENIEWMMQYLSNIDDDVERIATLMVLNENYENALISHDAWLGMLVREIEREQSANVSSLMSGYLKNIMRPGRSEAYEEELWRAYEEHPSDVCRKYILNVLIKRAFTQDICRNLYTMWRDESSPLLGVNDYMELSYQLSLRFPERSEFILQTQLERLEGDTRQNTFEFVSEAVVPGEEDNFFESLKSRKNRVVEPWVLEGLALINHPLREQESVKYIRPALELLTEIQRTGDIFFPMSWARALLETHCSHEALIEVQKFLDDNPDYKPLLKGKILQALWRMQRETQEL